MEAILQVKMKIHCMIFHICLHAPEMFLKYSVQFKSECLVNQLLVIVKWGHCLNLYRCDEPNAMCLLCVLTDNPSERHRAGCHESQLGCTSIE